MDDAIAFYRRAVPVIKQGFSRRYGPPVLNYAHPDGWQAVVRANDDHALIVIHTFGGELPQRIELPIPGGRTGRVICRCKRARLGDGIFEYCPAENFEGAAYLLRSVRSQA